MPAGMSDDLKIRVVKLFGAGVGLLITRLLYKKCTDTTANRRRRFHERFGTPEQGAFLVTGASSGVGLALATELSKTYGYELIIVARREANLTELASTLPTKCVVLPTDLQNAFADEAGVLNFRKRLEAALPHGKNPRWVCAHRRQLRPRSACSDRQSTRAKLGHA